MVRIINRTTPRGRREAGDILRAARRKRQLLRKSKADEQMRWLHRKKKRGMYA